MAGRDEDEIVFVVDVSSFSRRGFVGTTSYEGQSIDLEFDDESGGLTLNSEMAKRIHVRKGSLVSVVIENDRTQVVESFVGGVGRSLRMSDPKVYYAVGKEGGAILRVRKR